MRIAALEPFLVEFVEQLGLGESLVAVPHNCPRESKPVVTRARKPNEKIVSSNPVVYRLEDTISTQIVFPKELAATAPEIILTSVPVPADFQATVVPQLQADLAELIGAQPKLKSFSPKTLEQIFEMYEGVGSALGMREQGRAVGQRVKAQLMDWGSNFYDRMKNKKVSFLCSIDPLILGGLWIPDMIHLCSAVSQLRFGGEEPQQVEWRGIVAFRPDVIVVAPEGADMKTAMATFKQLEKLPGWEDVPAVKRGEVYFTEGQKHFYQAGVSMIDSMAILVSAVAGLESGFITPRDSFFKLRWMELQRHRL